MSKAVREVLGEIAEETRKLIRRMPERPAAALVARANAFVLVRVFLDRVIEPMKALSKLDRNGFQTVVRQLDDLSQNVDRINPHTLSVIGGRVDDILDATSVLKHSNVLNDAQTHASKIAETFRSFAHIYSVSYPARHPLIDKVLRISEEIEDAYQRASRAFDRVIESSQSVRERLNVYQQAVENGADTTNILAKLKEAINFSDDAVDDLRVALLQTQRLTEELSVPFKELQTTFRTTAFASLTVATVSDLQQRNSAELPPHPMIETAKDGAELALDGVVAISNGYGYVEEKAIHAIDATVNTVTLGWIPQIATDLNDTKEATLGAVVKGAALATEAGGGKLGKAFTKIENSTAGGIQIIENSARTGWVGFY